MATANPLSIDMCWAARFTHAGVERHCRFGCRSALLPVSARRGAQIVLLPWGRRPGETGNLPVGGWAKLTQIQSGLWDAFNPRPVKLLVSHFAERDVAGHLQWFQVTRGQFVQGCVVRVGHERRVYVVTLDCSPTETVFERWPRVVSQSPETAT